MLGLIQDPVVHMLPINEFQPHGKVLKHFVLKIILKIKEDIKSLLNTIFI